MKRRAPAFRELRRVFGGYLHEDFLVNKSTPSAALQEFYADADPGEVRRFRREVHEFLTYTAVLDFPEVLALLERLGCRWVPPSREALAAALEEEDEVE